MGSIAHIMGMIKILVTLIFITIYYSTQAATFPDSTNTQNENILLLGDSLSAGYGLTYKASWAYLLQQKLAQQQLKFNLINASISGDTTHLALLRINDLLEKYNPSIIIIALGSNDGLRGLELKVTKQNLQKIIELCQTKNIKVLLVGFRLPINYGKIYSEQFERVFLDLAKQYQTDFVPFLLAGFAKDLDYFQRDSIHPNQKAQALILNNVWPHLEQILIK